MEILDCLKRERDICVKTITTSQNTAFMWTPALTGLIEIIKTLILLFILLHLYDVAITRLAEDCTRLL